LTDIGFFSFSGFGPLSGKFFFGLDLRLMFVEHQSTSGTKISVNETLFKSAIALFLNYIITVLLVKQPIFSYVLLLTIYS